MSTPRPDTHRPGPSEATPTPGAPPATGAGTEQERRHEEEQIDEAVEETFPASDPPSYMPPEKSPGKQTGTPAASTTGGKLRDPEAEAIAAEDAEERAREEDGTPPPLPRAVEGQASSEALRDAADRRPDEQERPLRPATGRNANEATADQLRDAIDRGATGDKVPAQDPAAAPLGADEEAAGVPLQSRELGDAMREETRRAAAHGDTPQGQRAGQRPKAGGGFLQSMRRLFGGG